ncbi:MAG: hypothetical protein GW875_03615 [Deltaproteobacteria bacterium]|nr:hypothetical protein [Deltaproteobacteria bacterium]NCP03373.1 hypothetical protein [Deltaproteobacteria bacterium]NCP78344.1 hypothetical protein [Desulfuromonadales bacterium]
MQKQQAYCSRFGKIAVDQGFLSAEQLRAALVEQLNDNLANRPHRVIGAICFEHGWLTPGQIERILNQLFKRDACAKSIEFDD